MSLIDRELGGGILLIDRKFVELEDNAKYESLPKLTKLMKKSFNLNKTREKKLYRLISYFWLILLSLPNGLTFIVQRGWQV